MNTDKQGEILSALMDGEATELELRQLLADLDNEPAQCWARWHLVQDVLQGHAVQPKVDVAFQARIRAAIAEAPTLAVRGSQRHWLHSASRLAVAASVALAVVTGWQLWQQGNDTGLASGQNLAMHGPLSQVTPAGYDFQMTTPQVRYSYSQPDLLRAQPVADTFAISREEFNRMMARHNRDATSNQTMPYGRLVDVSARNPR